MSTEQKFDSAGLARMLAEAKFTFLQMAGAMLAADVLFAGWSRQTVQRATDYRARGARLVLEISAGASGAMKVSLVAVPSDGDRVEIGCVGESATGRAN